MTEPTCKTLNKYQAAMLTHMGIVPWQLKSNNQDSSQPESHPSEQKNTANSTPQVLSQEQKQAGLQRLRQKIESKTTSVKDGVLLCMPESQTNQLLSDLLLFAGLTITDCVFAEAADPQDFVDFKFAWQIGEKISLNGLLLTAPTPDKIISSQDKKQLWQILQQLF